MANNLLKKIRTAKVGGKARSAKAPKMVKGLQLKTPKMSTPAIGASKRKKMPAF